VESFNEQTAPQFEAREGNVLFGRLTISRGGVRWLPADFSEPHFFASWAEFDAVMRKQRRC